MSRRNSLLDPSTIRAVGPGLTGGRVGEECKFRIEGTDGGLALSFHIEGPSKPIFETCACTDLSLDITYIPLLPGDYKLSLMWYGKNIEGSPFEFKVEGDGPEPTVEELVQKVKVNGKGLDYPRAQEYNEVLVDCRRVFLKDHKLRCSVKSPQRCAAMVKLQDNQDGTYSMFYKPTFPASQFSLYLYLSLYNVNNNLGNNKSQAKSGIENSCCDPIHGLKFIYSV